ncbi:MAG: DUF4336 domain-containing protein [Gammaproteobacteria bacterium]
MAALREFGPSIYVADGPAVPFFGFPYTTRMALVKLSGGDLWAWSPVALTDELIEAVNALGPVRYIVSPNKIHHLFLAEWTRQWPDARLYAPPGLARKKPDLHFSAELGDEPDSAWEKDIDQVIFRGSAAMEEVVFFHRKSRTAIVGDLIQRFPEAAAKGWKGYLMRFDSLVGKQGSTPREWRLSFLRRKQTRAAREKLLAWQPDKLLIAHGECVDARASPVIEEALSWI